MDNYISKEYLTEHIKACWINGRPKHAPELHELLSWIDEVPPEYVQPVIHCKDCVYWSSKETRYCNMLKGTFQENDYCSYGERKGADGEVN